MPLFSHSRDFRKEVVAIHNPCKWILVMIILLAQNLWIATPLLAQCLAMTEKALLLESTFEIWIATPLKRLARLEKQWITSLALLAQD